jgi:hypothetical protein
MWSGPAPDDAASPTPLGFFEQARSRPKTPAELDDTATVAKRLDYPAGSPKAAVVLRGADKSPALGSLGSLPLAETPNSTPHDTPAPAVKVRSLTHDPRHITHVGAASVGRH